MTRSRETLLQAFNNLVQTMEDPLLFEFKEYPLEKTESRPPLTEILNTEYQGKIRFFELNFNQSQSILETFQLPPMPTAVIFWKGKTRMHWQGYRNVRVFLRKLLFPK